MFTCVAALDNSAGVCFLSFFSPLKATVRPGALGGCHYLAKCNHDEFFLKQAALRKKIAETAMASSHEIKSVNITLAVCPLLAGSKH